MSDNEPRGLQGNTGLDRLRRELEQCLEERSALAQRELDDRRLIENLTGGYFFYRHDSERRYSYLSPSVEQVLGYTPEEYIELYATLFTDSPVNQEARLCTERAIAGEAQYSFEAELRVKDGSVRQVEVSEVPVFGVDGGVALIEGIVHDVTERKRRERRLEEQATLDELTGLYNRRHLRVRLDEAIALARRHEFPMSMAMVDLDGLKSVNDSFGHAAGDKMICAAAEILRRELRRGDVLGRLERIAGRLGGDEFAALLPYSNARQARVAMRRVLAAFDAEPVLLAVGSTRVLRASIGIAELGPEESAESLEGRADEALYRAKRERRGQIVLAAEPDS